MLLQRHVWGLRSSATVSSPLVTACSAHFRAAAWKPVRQSFEQNRWGFPPCRGVNGLSHQRQFMLTHPLPKAVGIGNELTGQDSLCSCGRAVGAMLPGVPVSSRCSRGFSPVHTTATVRHSRRLTWVPRSAGIGLLTLLMTQSGHKR